jgi:hypothetical protein
MRVALALMVIGFVPADAAWSCAHPDNRLTNCGFTSDLSGWALGSQGTYEHHPTAGSSQPGALFVLSGGTVEPFASFGQCVSNLTGGTSYGYGIDAQIFFGFAGCNLLIEQWANLNCAPPANASSSLPLDLDVSWAQFQGTHTTDATTRSISFTMVCFNSSGLYALRFDDAFYGPGLVPVELSTFTID